MEQYRIVNINMELSVLGDVDLSNKSIVNQNKPAPRINLSMASLTILVGNLREQYLNLNPQSQINCEFW